MVLVVEEKFKKPMAVGISLFNSEEARKMIKGIIIKNLHNHGDEILKSIKEINNEG